MSDLIRTLIGLTNDLQRTQTLEDTLRVVVERAARALATPHVSIRLLDVNRKRLLATARAGESLHSADPAEFNLGEGLVGWIALHGTAICAPYAGADPRFVQRPGQSERLRAFLGVPIVAGGHVVGVLAAVHSDDGFFQAVHEHLLTLVAGICAPYVEVARLERLAHRDPLTGSLNRRALETTCPDGAGPVCIAIADVDHFKAVNDTHGHAAGDHVLRTVADTLAAVVRTGDSVVRYGGEEFVLVLPGVDASIAMRVVERARTTVETTPVVYESRQIAVTVSIGVAERRAGECQDDLLARADAALYAAKQTGRNRVIAAE
jgi:diguanylate cyclase (GGDEF)-like protein